MPQNLYLFRDFALQWLEVYKKHSGIRGNTYIESYLKTVDNFLIPKFGNKYIDKITPMEIRMYINEIGQSYSKSTVSKVLLCLNQIYAAAIENGICSINPAANVVAHSQVHSKKKRTYTQAEVEEVIAFSATHEYGL